MAKDPAFLFYPGDYISGTMGMTFEEKGAYIDLLMMQFNRGHMSKRMIAQVVGDLWDKFEDKFEVDADGKFYNIRLEEEQKKRKAFTASRRNNKSGKNQHSKKVGHTSNHMEDENENKDNIKIKGDILNSKAWIEKICMKKKINYDVAISFLKNFLDDLELKGELDKPEKDIKSHFVNWLNIELKKVLKNNDSESTTTNR